MNLYFWKHDWVAYEMMIWKWWTVTFEAHALLVKWETAIIYKKFINHKSPRVRMGVEPENRKLSKYCIASPLVKKEVYLVCLWYTRDSRPPLIFMTTKKNPKSDTNFYVQKIEQISDLIVLCLVVSHPFWLAFYGWFT